MGTRRTQICFVALVALVALVACGGDGEPSSAGVVEPADSAIVRLCDSVPKVTATVVGDGSIGGPGYVFMGVVNTYAAEHQDVFSGAWIDHDAGGTYAVAFTDDPEPHRAALAARAPSADDLAVIDPPPEITDRRPIGEWDVSWDVVRVERTRDDILESSETIWNTLEAAGIDINTSGVDVRRSRFTIGLVEPTAAKLVEIAELVDPDLVCVEGPLVDPDRPQPQPGDALNIIIAGDSPPDTLIKCEGIAIPLSAVLDPQPLKGSGQVELEAGLTDVFRTLPTVPSTGEWFILHNDDETAVLAIAGQGGAASVVTLRRTAVGWTFKNSGGCEHRPALPEGLGHVAWRVDPGQPQPSADTTEFDVAVTEGACASGEPMGDRLLGPQIVETETEVLIAFAAIRSPGLPREPRDVSDRHAQLATRHAIDQRRHTHNRHRRTPRALSQATILRVSERVAERGRAVRERRRRLNPPVDLSVPVESPLCRYASRESLA